jgi:hypothetical protein
MPTQPYDLSTKRDIVLGAGYVYFDPEDASGNLTGEIYLGDGPGFSFSMSAEKTEIDSSDTPTAETLISITNKVTRASQVGVRHISEQNLAFFIAGDVSTVSQTAVAVTNEAHTVLQGRYYQLGSSTSNPSGVRGVGSVVVTNEAGDTTYDITDDYLLDTAGGRIFIVEGGAIASAAAQVIHVDYTPVANSRQRVASGTSPKKGALRFVSDNTAGANREVYFPRVELTPSGEAPMKDRANPVELSFDVSVLTRSGYQQVYIDGVAVAS